MNYNWIELSWRTRRQWPFFWRKQLHDSGYRYLRLRGARLDEKKNVVYDDLNQWSDHAVFNMPVNIDVTEDGTLRIQPWHQGSAWNDDKHFFSSASFHTQEWEAAAKCIRDLNRIHFKVRAETEAAAGVAEGSA